MLLLSGYHISPSLVKTRKSILCGCVSCMGKQRANKVWHHLIRTQQGRISKYTTTFASGAAHGKTILHHLRVWLRGKFDVTLRPLAAFFLRQGKQGFFFEARAGWPIPFTRKCRERWPKAMRVAGGSTPFLFAPSKRNGVEKAHSEMNTISKGVIISQFARLLARKLISVVTKTAALFLFGNLWYNTAIKLCMGELIC